MSSTTRILRRYDHRLRDLVRSTGDIGHATRRGVPRSTARGWLTPARTEVVTVDVVDMGGVNLQQEVLALHARVERLVALLRLVVVLSKVSGFSLACARLPDGAAKISLLRAIERSRSALPLRTVLRVLRLSQSRYHSWKREEECGLDDMPSCPRSSPQQLTRPEVETIKEMVTSEEYRHVPTGTLALLAQRLGKVFASPTTWFRLVRLYKWRRPRLRIHPAKPKVGIRGSSPNEIWHVDTTLIRLLDGTRAYLHAVIDNFSRRILAWKVSSTFDPSTTAELLLNAASGLVDEKPTLLVDGGVENFNSAVDALVDSGVLQRLLAMTDISFSNSLIESWWRALKHQWLFLNTLDTVSRLEKLVTFYVDEHNTRLPHSAFRGQTPDEMYFGTGDRIPDELDAAKKVARQSRMEVNRATLCPTCQPLVALAS
ncbi:MAG: DDE-type integrase/transposase/recombinase [Planctomycetes bacterium]|nr:DDE-type integrase/transposase/recombinase [Planctomycetota bacterium]